MLHLDHSVASEGTRCVHTHAPALGNRALRHGSRSPEEEEARDPKAKVFVRCHVKLM